MSRDNNTVLEHISRRRTLEGIAAAGGIIGLSGGAAANPGNGNGCDLKVNPGSNSPNHYDTIQNAVVAASSGDTVCVTQDTYDEHVVVDKDITLKGVGNRDKIVVDAPDGEPYAIEVLNDNVTVKNLTATGATSGDAEGLTAQNTTGVHLENLVIRDNDDRGLTVGHSEDATLKKITAKNNGDDGITVWQSHDCTVSNCEAFDNGDNGIYTNGNNNIVEDSTAHGNGDQGIDMSNDHDIENNTDQEWGGATVKNCESFDNDNGGIELHDDEGDATVKNCHTHDNDIASDNDASGLVLNNTSSVEVATGNDFEDGIAVNGIDTDP